MTEDLKIRYSRQIAVEDIGLEGQRRILEAKILIIGAGALGSMVAMQLAGAGISTIGIADYDNIDISNLQRQFFFHTKESGKSKVDVISRRISDLNPEVVVKEYKEMITPQKAEQIIPFYDFIVDATDNPASKRMVGEISKKYGKACVIGGVRDFKGQIMTLLPDDPRLEEFFGKGASEGYLPCSLAGVIGPAAALCSSILSSETIKYITKSGELLSGKLLIFDLLSNSFHVFCLSR